MGAVNPVAGTGIAGCGRGGDERAERPLKIGYVVNYMSHEWYQNICKAAETRARELGVDLWRRRYRRPRT